MVEFIETLVAVLFPAEVALVLRASAVALVRAEVELVECPPRFALVAGRSTVACTIIVASGWTRRVGNLFVRIVLGVKRLDSMKHCRLAACAERGRVLRQH